MTLAPDPYPTVVNPYAPPVTTAGCGLPDGPPGPGLWRERDALVMQRGAILPALCIKSNVPATQTLKRKLQYLSPWFILLALVSLPIFAIVSLIVTKRETILIGLSDDWIDKRRTRMCLAWGCAAVGALCIGLGLVLALPELQVPEDLLAFAVGVPIMIGVVLLLAGSLIGNYGCRMIHASKIDDARLWIKGVHPDFLNRLPEWPGA